MALRTGLIESDSAVHSIKNIFSHTVKPLWAFVCVVCYTGMLGCAPAFNPVTAPEWVCYEEIVITGNGARRTVYSYTDCRETTRFEYHNSSAYSGGAESVFSNYYNPDGTSSRQVEYIPQINRRVETLFEYRDGLLIQERHYDRFNEESGSWRRDIYRITDYTYTGGLLTERAEYRVPNDLVTKDIYQYVYDAQGRCIFEGRPSRGIVTEYTYGEGTNKTGMREIHLGMGETNCFFFRYNDAGVRTAEYTFAGNVPLTNAEVLHIASNALVRWSEYNYYPSTDLLRREILHEPSRNIVYLHRYCFHHNEVIYRIYEKVPGMRRRKTLERRFRPCN